MTIASQVQAETYGADPVAVDIRQIDGSMITADCLSAMVMRGLGWIVQVGDLTTPVTGGGGSDVILAQQPELIIDVPAGWTLIPIRIAVDAETPLIASDPRRGVGLHVRNHMAVKLQRDRHVRIPCPIALELGVDAIGHQLGDVGVP